MFCTNCGTKIDAHVKFCPECGCPVKNSTVAENEQQSDGNIPEANHDQGINNVNINNVWYRMLQLSPIIFIMAAVILPLIYYVLLLKLVAVIYVIICCKCDIAEIKRKTSRTVAFDGLSIFAILIFDILYAEKYLCNRKKIIPQTSRIPFYLSLIAGIIILFSFPQNNLFKLYELDSKNLSNNTENPFDNDLSLSDIFNTGINCSSKDVLKTVSETLLKVDKLPPGIKLSYDGIATISKEGSVKVCQSSVTFDISDDKRKQLENDYKSNIFWKKIEKSLIEELRKSEKNNKKLSSLEKYYVDEYLATFVITHDFAIKEIASGESNLVRQNIEYTVTEFDDGTGFYVSIQPEQIKNSWLTLARFITRWGNVDSIEIDSTQPDPKSNDTAKYRKNDSKSIQIKPYNTTSPKNTYSQTEKISRITEGIYAVYNLGDFRNYEEGVFNCDEGYCRNMDKEKLSPEEQNFIQHSDIRGSVKIELNKPQNSYQATGGFMVKDTCMMSAGGDSLTTPVLCKDNRNDSITCEFYDVYNDQTLFLIFQTSGNRLDVSLDSRLSSISHTNNTQKCLDTIQNTPVIFESAEEHNRILILSTKLDFVKANDDILKVWRSLSSATRKQILPEQRKWIKEKDNKCGKADMKGSTEELYKMQKCHTEMTIKRIAELNELTGD